MEIPRQLRLSLICAVPVAVLIYALWYWNASHSELAVWYKNLYPHFYKAEQWEALFFTPAVKMAGNGWCAATLAAALVWTFLLWKTPAPALPEQKLEKRTAAAYLLIILAGTLLALAANQKAVYAADEVFSALNFAALPAFQTFSFYALPNNHPLFNGLNGSLFFWSGDLVQTGRLISLFCYVTALCFTWHFLKKQVESVWLRCLILLTVSLQLPAWGFSGQARGYELVLLCSCLSLFTFFSYFSTKNKELLPLHTAGNAAGLLTVPTYLYWWLGLLLAASILQWTERKLDRAFLRTTVTGFAASLLLWLPLFTFSGLAVLTENKYVQAGDATPWHFLNHLNQNGYFNGLFKEWFGTDSSSPAIGLVCCLLPVLLFFYPKKDKNRRVLGIANFSIWLTFLGMAVFMVKLPFYRNLIAHGYLALLLLLISLAPLFRSKAMKIIFGMALTAFAAFSAYRNYDRLPNHLYYYDAVGYFQELSSFKTEFRPGSTVYLDNECFYWWYVLREKYPGHRLDISLNRPAFHGQDYCVMPLDSLPPGDASLYRLTERIGEYQVFEK